MSDDPVVPTLRPAVLDVGAWPPPPVLAGPENPRKERGGGMRGPVLLLFRPWVRGGPWVGPLSENRGTTGGSAAMSGTGLVVFE
jgi:hypothetical protein